MATDLHIEHEAIVIEHEMHAKELGAYFHFLSESETIVEAMLRGKAAGWTCIGYGHRRPCIAPFATASKKAYSTRKIARFHGIKAPEFERYFNEFETNASIALLAIFS